MEDVVMDIHDMMFAATSPQFGKCFGIAALAH
jgi:hypothetical protein